MKNLPRLNNKKAALPLLAVAGAAAIIGGALWLGKRRRAVSQQPATDKLPENTSGNLRHPFRKQHGLPHQGKRGPQA